MPLGLGEIAVIVVAGVIFLGPKKVIPRLKETMAMAKELAAKSAAQVPKQAESTAASASKAKPPSSSSSSSSSGGAGTGSSSNGGSSAGFHTSTGLSTAPLPGLLHNGYRTPTTLLNQSWRIKTPTTRW